MADMTKYVQSRLGSGSGAGGSGSDGGDGAHNETQAHRAHARRCPYTNSLTVLDRQRRRILNAADLAEEAERRGLHSRVVYFENASIAEQLNVRASGHLEPPCHGIACTLSHAR